MTIALEGPLLLVGAGNMGGALLRGWLERGLPPRQVVVQDPSPAPAVAALLAEHGIAHAAAAPPLAAKPAVILLAVKPQDMDAVAGKLGDRAAAGTLVISVAAGRTLASLAPHFPPGTAIVRTIPNTPAAIGRGITVAVAGASVTPAQRALAERLLAAVGEVGWVDDEELIDAATAVSGSGPAYVFLLAECLAKAAEEAGLPPAIAARLARATVAGAGELLHRSDLDPAALRRNVTSPKGTTQAALDVLMGDGGLEALLTRAVAAAKRRAAELAR